MPTIIPTQNDYTNVNSPTGFKVTSFGAEKSHDCPIVSFVTLGDID